jgi:hypothetical protein
MLQSDLSGGERAIPFTDPDIENALVLRTLFLLLRTGHLDRDMFLPNALGGGGDNPTTCCRGMVAFVDKYDIPTAVPQLVFTVRTLLGDTAVNPLHAFVMGAVLDARELCCAAICADAHSWTGRSGASSGVLSGSRYRDDRKRSWTLDPSVMPFENARLIPQLYFWALVRAMSAYDAKIEKAKDIATSFAHYLDKGVAERERASSPEDSPD